MSKDKLTIYCCYHDKKQLSIYNLQNNDIFNLFYSKDGLLNKYISEFSMYYWIWKNDKESEYIGTCHYRRTIYEYNFDKNLVNDKSCQYYEKIIYGINADGKIHYGLKDFCYFHRVKFIWNDYVEYLKLKINDYEKYLKQDSKKDFFYGRSIFFYNKKTFNNLCEFIFGFLDFLNYKYDLMYDDNKIKKWIDNKWIKKGYKNLPWGIENRVSDMYRLIAYVFEQLVSIYLQANDYDLYPMR